MVGDLIDAGSAPERADRRRDAEPGRACKLAEPDAIVISESGYGDLRNAIGDRSASPGSGSTRASAPKPGICSRRSTPASPRGSRGNGGASNRVGQFQGADLGSSWVRLKMPLTARQPPRAGGAFSEARAA